ncbi:MAG: DNA polymerase III subunit gamma/tau [Dehalococcoidia bacterium]
MPTEVLYRKWRPQRFADVSGQEIVTRTLINALTSHKVSHAYLFSGPRGTGKTTVGRLLAKAINCEKNAVDQKKSPGEPCNACASCVAYDEGRALDLVEMDGASNRGVEEIRQLRDKIGYAPTGGALAHKVYLIDEVHMLTDPAFNALLKTLEEPPPHIVFIMATTDAHKVPATIVSRCQRHDFKRIPLSATTDRLEYIAQQEDLHIPREALELIARAATGSLRDAINLLEQICDSYGADASLEAVREGLGLVADERSSDVALAAVKGDLARALQIVNAVRDDGRNLIQFQKEVLLRLRELLLVQAGAEAGGLLTPEQVQDARASVENVSRDKIVQVLKLLSQADLRQDPLSPLPLEIALAESTVAPDVSVRSAPEPAARPQAQRQPPPTRVPEFSNRPQANARPAPARPTPPAPATKPAADRVPADLRKDNITGASPEDIAKMVGSTSPVIPEAADEPVEPAAPTTHAAAPAAANGKTSNGSIDLASFVDAQLRPEARKRTVKLDALLNGSCHAVSFEDGVLTLGFYQDAHHKKEVEQAANRKQYEAIASELLGAPVTLRCIIVEKSAKPVSKSPLVQHAVQNHGAKIVTDE